MNAYFIDPERPDYEAAAILICVLAFPEFSKPNASLDQRFGEVCAYLLCRRAGQDPAWAEDLQPMRPMHVFIDAKRVDAMERKLVDRLQKRRLAGEWAIPFLEEALGGKLELLAGMKRLSQNAMAEYMAGQIGIDSGSNFNSRVVRPSYPVLHLCVVLAIWARMTVSIGRDDPVDLLMGRERLEAFVGAAIEMEPIVAASKLPVRGENLIPIRLSSDQVQQN